MHREIKKARTEQPVYHIRVHLCVDQLGFHNGSNDYSIRLITVYGNFCFLAYGSLPFSSFLPLSSVATILSIGLPTRCPSLYVCVCASVISYSNFNHRLLNECEFNGMCESGMHCHGAQRIQTFYNKYASGATQRRNKKLKWRNGVERISVRV